MFPKIIETYGEYGVNVGKIVKRIIKYAPQESIKGLKLIKILDNDPLNRGFACYSREEKKISIFVKDLIEWQPWFLKKTIVIPYLAIGLALGHEIDHHVNRNNDRIDKEESAESNALTYVYPSFGIFKPVAKIILFVIKKVRRIKQ